MNVEKLRNTKRGERTGFIVFRVVLYLEEKWILV